MVKLSIVAYYEYNRQYIAANLCENRDKPQLKCCGKCYLRKQLKKADDGADRSGPAGKGQWSESSAFILPEIVVMHQLLFAFFARPCGYYQQSLVVHVSGAVFHPPQAA